MRNVIKKSGFYLIIKKISKIRSITGDDVREQQQPALCTDEAVLGIKPGLHDLNKKASK